MRWVFFLRWQYSSSALTIIKISSTQYFMDVCTLQRCIASFSVSTSSLHAKTIFWISVLVTFMWSMAPAINFYSHKTIKYCVLLYGRQTVKEQYWAYIAKGLTPHLYLYISLWVRQYSCSGLAHALQIEFLTSSFYYNKTSRIRSN